MGKKKDKVQDGAPSQAPSAPSDTQPQLDSAPRSAHSAHLPPGAQPLPSQLSSPSPLSELARDKGNKELWLIQVPRNVDTQLLGSMQLDWPTKEDGKSKQGPKRMKAQPCDLQGDPYTLVTQDLEAGLPSQDAKGGGTQGRGTPILTPVITQGKVVMMPVDRRMVLVKGEAHIEETDEDEAEQERLLLRDLKEVNKEEGTSQPQQQQQQQQGTADKKASKKAKREAQAQPLSQQEAAHRSTLEQGGPGSGYAFSDEEQHESPVKKKQKNKEKKQGREEEGEERAQVGADARIGEAKEEGASHPGASGEGQQSAKKKKRKEEKRASEHGGEGGEVAGGDGSADKSAKKKKRKSKGGDE